MSLGFSGGPRRTHCRFCAVETHPEALAPLEVPYLRNQRAPEACPACAADFEAAGWTLGAPRPGPPPAACFCWPGVEEADVAAAEAAGESGLAEALRGAREAARRLERIAGEEEPVRAHLRGARVARPLDRLWLSEPALARLAFGLDGELEGALLRAWESCDDFLPSYTYSSELHARVAVVLARLTLELGERAPKSYGPRKQGPAAWLDELREQARGNTSLRDSRAPLIRALLYREEGNLSAVDSRLHEARGWSADGPSFELAYALHVRARDRSRWVEARDWLKRCCALRPAAAGLFTRLAHAYLDCAQPEVAREILAAQVGESRVTAAGVTALVQGSLRELRPELEARAASGPELHLLLGACLLGLGEHDEAWRVLEGSSLLDAIAGLPELETPAGEGGSSTLAEGFRLAALAARARGQVACARRLAGAAWALLRGTGKGDVAARRDYLCLVLEELEGLLTNLEEETRGRELTGGRGEGLGPGADATPAFLQEHLEDLLVGDAGDGGRGLAQIHERVRAAAPALLAETSDYERAEFAAFLARELASRFRPLVTPPSVTDRQDLRVSDARLRLYLAYLALMKRRLPDALREERAARGATGHGTPLRLLLLYLELVRRAGPAGLALAARGWNRLPLRREPLQVGLLIVPEEAIEARDVDWLVSLFRDRDVEAGRTGGGRPGLRELQGRCVLVFPPELSGEVRDPRLRGYVHALFAACPAFPFVLDLEDSEAFREFFACLASPDALDAEGRLDPRDASVRSVVVEALAAMCRVAEDLELDPAAVCAPLLRHCDPDAPREEP